MKALLVSLVVLLLISCVVLAAYDHEDTLMVSLNQVLSDHNTLVADDDEQNTLLFGAVGDWFKKTFGPKPATISQAKWSAQFVKNGRFDDRSHDTVINKQYRPKNHDLVPSDYELSIVYGNEVPRTNNQILDKRPSERVIVISDTHVASNWLKSQPGNEQRLLKFLKQVAANTGTKKIDTLIIAGDIVELWNYAMDVVPKTPLEVLGSKDLFGSNVPTFFSYLREVVKAGIRLVILRGNHDYELSYSALATQMQSLPFIYCDVYIANDVRYEHGHSYDLFNGIYPKYKKETQRLRPFGVFVARAATTSSYGSNTKNRVIDILSEIDSDIWGPAAVKIAKLSKKVTRTGLNQILETAYQKDIPKSKVWRCGNPFGGSSCVTLNEDKLLNYYEDMVHRFATVYTDQVIGAMIHASIGNHEYFHERQRQAVVVFGHTHYPMLVEYDRKNGYTRPDSVKVLYANSGSWVEKGLPTYLDITINPQTQRVSSVLLRGYSDAKGIDGSVIQVSKTVPQ